MYILVGIFHVVACLVLIAVILLQSGRGGGLSEMLGGGGQQTQKIFGTQTNKFMTTATSYCAVIFIITSITLGVMTSNRGKSLLAGAEIKPFFDDQPNVVLPKELQEAVENAQAEAQVKSEAVVTDTAAVVEKAVADPAPPAESVAVPNAESAAAPVTESPQAE
jgi:preprotein translocase subunit SecG